MSVQILAFCFTFFKLWVSPWSIRLAHSYFLCLLWLSFPHKFSINYDSSHCYYRLSHEALAPFISLRRLSSSRLSTQWWSELVRCSRLTHAIVDVESSRDSTNNATENAYCITVSSSCQRKIRKKFWIKMIWFVANTTRRTRVSHSLQESRSDLNDETSRSRLNTHSRFR